MVSGSALRAPPGTTSTLQGPISTTPLDVTPWGARKLLVALWRYVTQGVIPEGAVLKA